MIGYNERAWAIDLITEINKWANSRDVFIKRAGGESTLQGNGSKLFPDVIIFGDKEGSKILQGWELKFPDTDIDDQEFQNNAKKKAEILHLNSFLIWNVRYAKLIKIKNNGETECLKTWDKLTSLTSRSSVKANEHETFSLLHDILYDLLEFFNKGTISPTRIIDSITGEGVSQIILENRTQVASELERMASKEVNLRDSVHKWWYSAHREYQKRVDDYDGMWNQKATMVLVSWVNKILFSHTLVNFYEDFLEVDSDAFNSSAEEALEIFTELTKKHDFWNIFETQNEDKSVTGIAWKGIVELNKFLKDARIHELPRETITEMLSLIIEREKRKAAGQFTTPPDLAKFMVNIGMENLEFNFLDPCCGTGTIAKAAFNQKLAYGLEPDFSLSTVWASDKFSLPVQMTTITMIKPENIGKLIRVFKEDVISLRNGKEVELNDPYSGNVRKEKLPIIHYIVSNLPFVENVQAQKTNPEAFNVNKFLCGITNVDGGLSGRSDLYAYIVLHLWNLIADDGIITINISNSWLAANWSSVFRKYLMHLYKIDLIVTSGNGRWFSEPKVVTNVLVIRKRKTPIMNDNQIKNEKISFIVLSKKLAEYNSSLSFAVLASLIKTSDDGKNDNFFKITYTIENINELVRLGLNWNALFTKCSWIIDISSKLINTSKFFEIKRGSRRGWDDMFYPTGNHNIENIFLVPFLKSTTSINSFVTKPDSVAFCCDMSMEKLQSSGFKGAINWIRRFEVKKNGKNKPLPKILQGPSNTPWYSMSPNEIADIVTSINPGDRLFFARLNVRSPVNQRLIRFVKKNDEVDLELLHALMNSVISLFYLEAIGFGRGMGALDINAQNLNEKHLILNPELIDDHSKEKIKEKFRVICSRKIRTIKEELNSNDRQQFEDAVFSAFNLLTFKDKVISSLEDLYNLRTSVIL